MIRISKEEKFALVKKYPELQKEIVRSEIQHSDRGAYYVPEVPKVLGFLNQYWKTRTIERWARTNG